MIVINYIQRSGSVEAQGETFKRLPFWGWVRPPATPPSTVTVPVCRWSRWPLTGYSMVAWNMMWLLVIAIQKKDRQISETPQQLDYSGHETDVNSQRYQGLDPQPHELLNAVLVYPNLSWCLWITNWQTAPNCITMESRSQNPDFVLMGGFGWDHVAPDGQVAHVPYLAIGWRCSSTQWRYPVSTISISIKIQTRGHTGPTNTAVYFLTPWLVRSNHVNLWRRLLWRAFINSYETGHTLMLAG